MRPWVERRLEPQEMAVFHRIVRAVEQLPDDINSGALGVNDSGRTVTLTCHILARAAAKVYGLQHQDGFFYNGCDHSWLVTPAGQIIDVYPVGMLGGPIMVDHSPASPWYHLYTSRSARCISDHRFSKPWFRKAVRRVITILRRLDKLMNVPSP